MPPACPDKHGHEQGPRLQKRQSPTCGRSSGKAEPSAPWVLLPGGARREMKGEASALNECLTLQSRHPGYFGACLLSHAMHTLKEKPNSM